MANVTYGELVRQSLLFLQDKEYKESDLRYLLMLYKNWTLTDYLLAQTKIVPKDDVQWFKEAIVQLQKNYPLQYIVGYENFFDREFQVTEDTLIPRPETEWIVEYILNNEVNQEIKVADIGTGSGAIGITLKLEHPQFAVVLTDIDKKTLEVAKTNASRLGAKVEYCLGDNLLALDDKYDIIVSNPPYIAEEEQEVMDSSVLQYEPKQALFANNHGYAFYEQFCQLLPQYLKDNGRVYLEIGYQQGPTVQKLLLQQFPHRKVNIYQDYNGHDRLVAME